MGEQLRGGTIRWAGSQYRTWVGGVEMRLTLPSRVLSAEERMKRMDPLDIIAVVCSEV